MPHFAAVFARTPREWAATEVDLDEVASFDDITEIMRDAAHEPDQPVVLFVEEDDEWFGVARLNGEDGEARVFISDARAPLTSPLAGLLYEGVSGETPIEEEEDTEGAQPLNVETTGDPELLTDLGVSADELIELTLEEGMLPADTLATLAERIGFGDEFDGLR